MDAAAGPYLASIVLLVLAGASKLRDPLPLVRALLTARVLPPAPLRQHRRLVRSVASAEVLLGLYAAASGSRPAAVGVAASYAVFTAFVLLARRRGGALASCGCFGTADTPPTTTHVVVTGALSLVAGAVAVRPLGPLDDLLARQGAAGLPLLAATAAVAVTGYLVLALLPRLQVAR